MYSDLSSHFTTQVFLYVTLTSALPCSKHFSSISSLEPELHQSTLRTPQYRPSAFRSTRGKPAIFL